MLMGEYNHTIDDKYDSCVSAKPIYLRLLFEVLFRSLSDLQVIIALRYFRDKHFMRNHSDLNTLSQRKNFFSIPNYLKICRRLLKNGGNMFPIKKMNVPIAEMNRWFRTLIQTSFYSFLLGYWKFEIGYSFS